MTALQWLICQPSGRNVEANDSVMSVCVVIHNHPQLHRTVISFSLYSGGYIVASIRLRADRWQWQAEGGMAGSEALDANVTYWNYKKNRGETGGDENSVWGG